MRRTVPLLVALLLGTAALLVPGPAAVAVDPPGHVVGTITRAIDGTPLGGTTEALYSETSPGVWMATQYQAAGLADGTYSIEAPAGTYRLESSVYGGPDALQRAEFWPDSTTAAAGSDVVVTSGGTTTANLALDQQHAEMRIRPVITGHRYVGQKLTVDNGTWFPSGSTFTRQWVRAGTPIPGATGLTYTPTAADLGKALGVEVTVNHAGLQPTKGVTDGTAPIRPGLLTVVRKGKVTGTPKVGNTLRLAAPVTSPTSTPTYQWLRNGKAIAGATKASLRLVAADRGKKVGVRVVLSRADYTSLVRTATLGVR